MVCILSCRASDVIAPDALSAAGLDGLSARYYEIYVLRPAVEAGLSPVLDYAALHTETERARQTSLSAELAEREKMMEIAQ